MVSRYILSQVRYALFHFLTQVLRRKQHRLVFLLHIDLPSVSILNFTHAAHHDSTDDDDIDAFRCCSAIVFTSFHFSLTLVMHFFPHKAVTPVCSFTHCWRSRFRISLYVYQFFYCPVARLTRTIITKTRACVSCSL